jgi:predicted DCC family thiol-disulfide oxidoreductase YuxK
MAEAYLVLWDGECGFCRRSVDWLLARDKEGQLEAVPFQMAPSPPMTPELEAACARAVHVITPQGRVHRAGRAVLVALEVVGFRFWARLLRLPPFIWLLEIGYWIVARNRRRFSRVMFRPRPPSS